MPINPNDRWEDPPLRVPLQMRDIKRIRIDDETLEEFTSVSIECPFCGCSLLPQSDGSVFCSNRICPSCIRRWQLAIVEKEK